MLPLYIRKTGITPRLFQQICRAAPSRTIKQPDDRARQWTPEPGKATFSSTAKKFAQEKGSGERLSADGNNDGIHYYDQDPETGERRRARGDPDDMEAEEVRQRIKELDAEIKAYEKPNDDGLDESILSVLSPQERAKLTKAYKEQQERRKAAFRDLAIPQQAWFSDQQARAITQLNKDLKALALSPGSGEMKTQARRRYNRVLTSVPNLASILPAKAETLVWRAMDDGPHRDNNLARMADQKQQAGIPLSLEQSITAIEAHWRSGRRYEALKILKSLEEGEHRNDLAVLRLKVFLFSDSERFDDALNTLRTIFELSPRHDPRVVMHLIIGASEAGKKHFSFAMYIWMRQRLGKDMTMKDYDAMSLHYLVLGKKDLALAVFRDMMLSLIPAHTAESTPLEGRQELNELYSAVLGRLGLMQKMSTTVEDVHSVSMTALTALPRSWQNKYFYASWLKKLIGAGQVDQAGQIIDLMYEHGVRPDAKHVNGYLGALFRTGLREDRDKARALGWSMIQNRIDFIRTRDHPVAGAPCCAFSVQEDQELSVPLLEAGDAPRATIETFCVLAENYAVREEFAYIPKLGRMLAPAGITMNTYFMNQTLVAMGQAPAHQMWRTFQSLDVVKKDMQTFAVLWDRQIRHLVQVRQRKAAFGDFVSPRSLMRIMMTWSCTEESKTGEHRTLEQPWYETIMQCFCIRRDLFGLLVALHALKQRFDISPTEETQKLVCVMIASVQADRERGTRAGRVRKLEGVKQMTYRARTLTQVMEDLEKSRGGKPSTGDSNVGTVNLDSLSHFILEERRKVAGDTQSRIEALEAKHSMGADDVSMEWLSVLDDQR